MDDDGQGKGNVDQTKRIYSFAEMIGWTIGKLVVENDLSPGKGKVRAASAFKRRKIRLPNGRTEMRVIRPGFRGALDDLAAGTYDGFLALDLDRTVRDPRDLEDMIDVVEEHRVPVASVTGSLRLANDADVTMARVMVAVGNKESRDKARRVSAARERQALAGEFGGGRRPYGFEVDGVTVRPDEEKVIVECTNRLVQGATMRALAADLRKRGVATVTGAPWKAQTLRDILMRPRNAGRMVFRGEEVGDAPWQPLVPLETFRAVQRILGDPDRKSGPGAAPKWLGTSIYRCGVCTPPGSEATPVMCEVTSGGRQPRYKCKDHAHLTRNQAHVDALVVGLVVARLSRPDAVSLISRPAAEVDVAGLRAERDAIRVNLDEMAEDKALGLIDRAQLIKATKAGKDRMAEIDHVLQGAAVDSPLAPLIGAADVRAVWEVLPLSHQRLVLDALVTVTILPSGRQGRGFDPSSVDVVWKV